MCGFIASNGLERGILKQAIEDIHYRGLPDFKGYADADSVWMSKGFQFAHYSLPFVNLDPVKAIQPRKPSSGYPALFVGEIFNYKELGFEDDIEASIDTFRKEGPPGFNKFDGFWTFVTVFRGSLIGITDHLGIKPLYYRTDVEVLASEPDVLKQFGTVTRNELFHSNTMKWGYDPTGGTPWNEIKQVPPGHYYHERQVHKYWDWSKVSCTDLRTDLIESVRYRLGGQRDVSILLSGGLDSTIIHNIITQELGHRVTAIHVDNGEQDYAHLANPDAIQVTLDDVTDEDAVRIHQSPVDLGSTKPQIAMARKLKELGFHAVLTGDGADELFGGYRRAKEYDSQYSDVFCELPYYHLPKLDRTMMYSTIELRAPFLSPKVVARALREPYDRRNGEKKVLKEVFKDLVPQEILLRDKHPLKTDKIRKDPMEQRIINENIWRKLYD
jgi:asparagine synthase (glutamine-hydrolysing)